MLNVIRRHLMAKTPKKSKSPVKSAKRKVTIKDLKAKDAGSIKGGLTSSLEFPKIIAHKDVKISTINTVKI
jgi:hypothetical protein